MSYQHFPYATNHLAGVARDGDVLGNNRRYIDRHWKLFTARNLAGPSPDMATLAPRLNAVFAQLQLGVQLNTVAPLITVRDRLHKTGGRMTRSTAADQYAATGAIRFGIADADLDVATSLVNFAQRDPGFMIA